MLVMIWMELGANKWYAHMSPYQLQLQYNPEWLNTQLVVVVVEIQLTNNLLFKTFAKSISEELVSLSSIDAAIFWDVI